MTGSQNADADLVVFLDDDPVVKASRLMIDSNPSVDDGRWVESYMAPEVLAGGGRAALMAVHEGAGFPLPVRTAVVPVAELADFADAKSIRALVFRRAALSNDLLTIAPSLRLVQRYGHTAPTFDRAAFAKAGVSVCTIPRPSLYATAEHAVLLMLALGKRLVEADAAVRAGTERVRGLQGANATTANWAGLGDLRMLHGSTVGIIGLGEIGGDVARMLRPFGVDLVYYNRNRLPSETEAELSARYLPLPDLLAASDIVSIHATPTSRGNPILGAEELRAMKPGSLLVNTSRGWVVDEQALIEVLEDGHLAGAGLDVFDQEPVRSGNPLLRMSRVILTPHVAAMTRFAVFSEAKVLTENVARVLRGEAPAHEVVAN